MPPSPRAARTRVLADAGAAREHEAILGVASRAPSDTNTQPWKVHVLTGEPPRRLSERILATYDDPVERARHREEHDYYPTTWVPPYVDRRRKIGWDLYGLLGIGKGDKPAMHAQHGRNYTFFGAPVGIIFTIDRVAADEQVVCGMSIGYADASAVANRLVIERERVPVDGFTTFHG